MKLKNYMWNIHEIKTQGQYTKKKHLFCKIDTSMKKFFLYILYTLVAFAWFWHLVILFYIIYMQWYNTYMTFCSFCLSQTWSSDVCIFLSTLRCVHNLFTYHSYIYTLRYMYNVLYICTTLFVYHFKQSYFGRERNMLIYYKKSVLK